MSLVLLSWLSKLVGFDNFLFSHFTYSNFFYMFKSINVLILYSALDNFNLCNL